MRENSNEVLSNTPLMTKTTLSKKATALNEAAPTYPISIIDRSKAVFARVQETVPTPQSTISKIPTFYIHTMSTILPNCISRLVTNRSQQTNGSHNYNNPIKHLMRSFALLFLLLGFNSTVNAQSNANCYGPYNATPAPIWGIAEKFQTSVGIWNGGSPTAADLNGDGISELLVPAADQSGYFVYKGDGSNKTTATKNYVISNIGRYKSTQPAIANIITATATPEVVMINRTGFVYIFDNVSGTETNYLYKSTTATQYLTNGTPYIVDIDQDGTAEIVVGSDVFGIVNGALVKRVAGPLFNYIDGTFTSGSALDVVVVDIIASNPGKELVYGSRVYSVNLTAGTLSILKDMKTITGFTTIAAGDNGPTAVADMDLDGDLDVAYVGNNSLYIWDPNSMQVLLSKAPAPFNGGVRGLPMIANVYNEKVNNGKAKDYPEVVFVTSAGTTAGALLAYNLNFPTTTVWNLATDDMSGATGLTAFDFDGNGIREIVYRDQSKLRIINGNLTTPADYASIACTSATWGEYPIVGDFDNDGEADIAVTGDTKLRVFNRAANTFAWQDAPSYWNQRNYRIVNINSDLTVPTTENNAASSASINNNVAQLQFLDVAVGSSQPYGYTAAPDATIAITSVTGPCPALTINATITNNGAAILKAGTPVAIYDANPTTGAATLIGTYTTVADVAVGGTLNVSISLNLSSAITSVYVVVNDKGTTARPFSFSSFPNSLVGECDYTNNMANAAVVCLDTDNDGIANIDDIDDDNDGVLDTTEFGTITTGNYSNLLQSASTGTGTLSNACKSVNFTLNTTGTVTIANTNPSLGTLVVSNSCLFNNSNFSPMLASANTSGFRFEGAAGAKAGTMTFTFAQPVTNPIIYFTNVDSKYLDFGPTAGLSSIIRTAGNSSFLVQGTKVGRLDQGAVGTDNNFSSCSATTGGAAASGAGSIRLIGTFTTITADVWGISPNGDNILYNIALDNLACDTDNDGTPDYLDTDSDGDGCSDAKEAGATSSTTANFAFTTAVGTNGLADSLENVADNGSINYVSSYANNALTTAINACLDSDNDGITDLIDIDDDNDGVVDAVESPSCYFSANNWNTINKSSIAKVTTDLTMIAANSNVAALTDGLNTAAVQFVSATAQSQLNKELLKIELIRPTQLATIYINRTTGVEAFGPTPNALKVQGSNDDVSWTDLTAAMTLPVSATNVTNNGAITLATSNKFTLTTNLAAYKYYRIYGVAAANTAAGIISEIYMDVNTSVYQASLYPAATCTADVDNDTKLNHLDLDSDGDGCSDAKEAGTTTSTTAAFAFTGTMGTNGLDNTLETVADNGIYTGTYTYYFANNTLVNGCTDTDSDGIFDVKDIDDDNDGVTDCAEGITKPFNFAAPALFTNRNVDEAGIAQFSSYQAIPFSSQLLLPSGDANGNISLQLPAGVGVNTNYNLAFSIPTGVMVSSKGISISGYLTNDEYHEFNAGGVRMMVYDPANELDLWTGTAWIDMPDNFAGTTIRWRPKVNGTNFYFLIPDVTNFSWKYFNNNAVNQNGTTINISRACIEQDTDGDGKPNNLDLDSDADGCADATEAGSSTTATSTTVYPTGADANANGLLTTYENPTVGLEGFNNYTSTYNSNALSLNLALCRDFDNDGILDINDIDDDNDGVLDVVESPSCFFIKNNWNTNNKTLYTYNSSDLATLVPNTALFALTDGNGTAAAVQFNTATAQSQLNKELFKVIFAKPVQLDAWYIKKTSVTQIFAATAASLKVQGSNDNTVWTDLTAAIASPADATNITVNGAVSLTNSNKFTITQNAAKYKYYRIYGVAAANILSGIASEFYFDMNANYDGSMFPLAVCTSDTDNDGKFNYLDNDSDGDGCSDALEAGSTTATTANYQFTGTAADFGANGLINTLETVADNGVINYTSTYVNAVSNNIAYCADTDLDAVGNTDDIDDDNDGILDAVESPNCFYSSNNWLQGARPDILITSQLALTAGQNFPNRLVDGNNGAGNYDVRFVGATTGTPKEVFKFEMPTPIALNKIYLGYTSNATVFGTGTGITLKGSNDNTTWTNLSAQVNYITTTTVGAIPGIPGFLTANEFTVTQNAGKYKYYALVWTGGGSITNAGYVNEAYFKTDASYVPSSAPKPICATDSDQDGKPNHVDLDSDGDGCNDIVEAGVSSIPTATVLTGTMGANGFDNSVEMTPESNTFNGTYTYLIARDATVNACIDFDGDGATDLKDLDDDNDGILDIVECPVPGETPLTPKFNITSGASQTQTITGFPDELYIDIFDIDNNFN